MNWETHELYLVVESMKAFPVVVLLLASSLTVLAAEAALLETYDLVGEDPAGDSRNQEIPGQSSGQFANTRTDVLSLEMANDGSVVHFKLNIGTTPAGSGRYMYAAHFKVDGTAYFTCWNVAWIGGQASPAETENTLGCSRFTGETQVGPNTRAGGVQVASANGKNFVRWEVPKSAIKMGSGDLPISEISADTWFGGINNAAPSTSQSPYLWNRADRAPDAGAWAYSLTAAAPPLSLSFSMDPKNVTVGPAETVGVSLMPNLTGNGSVAFNWSIPDLPAGWNATFDTPNGTLVGGENVTHNLTILVPDDATNQTTNLTVVLSADNNLTAAANITITVDTTLARPPVTTAASGSATPTTSASGNATAAADEASGIPSMGAIASAVGLIAVVAALRSRRKN